VIDAGKKTEAMPELGKGRYVTIRTVADELEVDGTLVKNAEVILVCEADSVLAVKGRY
jgi:archaeosine-15-forming tRNA-guanine transglycosylase